MSTFTFGSQNLILAIVEVIFMLFVASLLGWLLANMFNRRRMRILLALIEEKKFELAEYRTAMNNPEDQPVATNASKTVYPITSADHEPDDFKVIEGIGPKIEEILNKEGIHTYEQLAETSIIRIAGLLKKAGPRFQIHDPTSWPKQALLAKEQKWEELEHLKSSLISG